jgi:hypothetical protein
MLFAHFAGMADVSGNHNLLRPNADMRRVGSNLHTMADLYGHGDVR